MPLTMKFHATLVLFTAIFNSSLQAEGSPSSPRYSSLHQYLQVRSKVFTRQGSAACSRPVVGQTFHLKLTPGWNGNKIISNDVITDTIGHLSTIFPLDRRTGLQPGISTLELCPGLPDKSKSMKCAEVNINTSDIRDLVVTKEGTNGHDATENVVYIQWCIDSASGEVIKESDFEGGGSHRVKLANIGVSSDHISAVGSNVNSRHVFKPVRGGDHLHNSEQARFRRRRSSEIDKEINEDDMIHSPFDLRGMKNLKRLTGQSDEIWIKKRTPSKRIWGDSGEAWLKRNDEKRIWGDSGEAWLKRNDNKRIWGDSGEAWLKRNSNKRIWGDSGEAWLKKSGNSRIVDKVPPEVDLKSTEMKRLWGDDGMAWV